MRLIGILVWYDERPSLLAASVSSLVRAGIDHLVAVDGAYVLYPQGQPSSGADQHDVIQGICRGAGIGCTLHVPADLYIGNEIEKRSLAFRLAEAITTDEDWYFLMDADQVITGSFGLRDALEDAGRHDVAEVLFHNEGDDPLSGFPVRCVFRALRGLHVFKTHCTYRTADGRTLWGNVPADRNPAQEPAILLPGVTVEHRPMARDRRRHEAKLTYYERRDRLGVEATC